MNNSTSSELFIKPNPFSYPFLNEVAPNQIPIPSWDKTPFDSSINKPLIAPSINQTSTDNLYETYKLEILTERLSLLLSSLIDPYSDSVIDESKKVEFVDLLSLYTDDLLEIFYSLLNDLNGDIAYRSLEIISSSLNIPLEKKLMFLKYLLIHPSPIIRLGAIDGLSWIKSTDSLDLLNSIRDAEMSTIISNAIDRAIARIST